MNSSLGGIYMSKIISKQNFIEKLRFYLSFRFSDDENASILNDYEEWFENETSQGKSEEEICATLDEPKKIVRNLLSESCNDATPISLLFNNTMIQVFLLMIMHLFIGILLLKICNENSLNYLYFAMGINFLYFIIGSIMIKKSCCPMSHNYGSDLSMFSFVVLVILFEALLLPRLAYSDSGKICVLLASAFSLVFFSINLYFVIKKFIYNKEYMFLSIFHISGIITLLFFLINQLHMLYNDMSELINLVCGSLCMYVEIVVLCLIFYKIKISAKE